MPMLTLPCKKVVHYVVYYLGTFVLCPVLWILELIHCRVVLFICVFIPLNKCIKVSKHQLILILHAFLMQKGKFRDSTDI